MDERREEGVKDVQCRESDAHHVDNDRTHEVLLDDRSAAAGDPQRLDELQQVVPEENHVGGLTRDLRSRAHTDPDERLGQGGRVVDPVAHHRHLSTRRLEPFDFGHLLLGEQVRNHVLEAQLGTDGPCYG